MLLFAGGDGADVLQHERDIFGPRAGDPILPISCKTTFPVRGSLADHSSIDPKVPSSENRAPAPIEGAPKNQERMPIPAEGRSYH